MTDNALTIETQEDGTAVTISVIGRVDGSTVGSLESTVQEIASRDVPAVIIDLERMTYVSSAGMRVFLLTAKQAQEGRRQGRVSCNLADNVREVFKVGGFDHILTLRDTKEEALELFRVLVTAHGRTVKAHDRHTDPAARRRRRRRPGTAHSPEVPPLHPAR